MESTVPLCIFAKIRLCTPLQNILTFTIINSSGGTDLRRVILDNLCKDQYLQQGRQGLCFHRFLLLQLGRQLRRALSHLRDHVLPKEEKNQSAFYKPVNNGPGCSILFEHTNRRNCIDRQGHLQPALGIHWYRVHPSHPMENKEINIRK